MYPHRIVLTAVALGIALLATGCAASAGADPGDGSDIPPTSGPAGSGPPPLPDSSPPPTPELVPITPVPGHHDRVAAWRPAGQSDGGRRLLLDVTIGGPPCDAVTGVDVTETGTAVTVTVHAGRLPSADCPSGVSAALATARVAAQLARPLGDRHLLGGTG